MPNGLFFVLLALATWLLAGLLICAVATADPTYLYQAGLALLATILLCILKARE